MARAQDDACWAHLGATSRSRARVGGSGARRKGLRHHADSPIMRIARGMRLAGPCWTRARARAGRRSCSARCTLHRPHCSRRRPHPRAVERHDGKEHRQSRVAEDLGEASELQSVDVRLQLVNGDHHMKT